MTILAKGKNFRGVIFALIKDVTPIVNPDHTLSYKPSFGVYRLCENYDGRVKGGTRKTWRYIKKDMTIDGARALFFEKTGLNPNAAA